MFNPGKERKQYNWKIQEKNFALAKNIFRDPHDSKGM